MTFYSDFQSYWPQIFVRQNAGDPFWLSIDLTRRPFHHNKVGMTSMLIVSVYFKHVRVFFPVSFTILESDTTPFELVKALQKIKIEVVD